MQAEIGCGMRIRARVLASIRDRWNADQVDLAGANRDGPRSGALAPHSGPRESDVEPSLIWVSFARAVQVAAVMRPCPS